MTLPVPQFLGPEAKFTQYRPAVASDGVTVIFERTATSGGATTLYSVVLGSGQQPAPFIQPSVPNPPTSQTRVDICWATGDVAFNGSSQGVTIQLYTGPGDGSSATPVPSSSNLLYAAWAADGSALATMNTSSSASPKPSTNQIDLQGNVLQANLNGDLSGTTNAMCGGMPAVNPTNSVNVAYAGQPNTNAWSGYDQAYNYVFVNAGAPGSFSSAPLEPSAPTTAFSAAFQGRAPSWSPDGRYVVFESSRLQGDYALFLFDTQNPKQAAVQLLDTSYGAQHAKFFPDGKTLILCAQPSAGAPFAIATLDVSAFVS